HRVVRHVHGITTLETFDDRGPNTGVQVQTGDDHRVALFFPQVFFKRTVRERIEAGFGSDRLIVQRLQNARRLISVGSRNAHPAIVLTPVRQPSILFAANRGPDVDDGKSALTAKFKESSGAADQSSGRRLKSG